MTVVAKVSPLETSSISKAVPSTTRKKNLNKLFALLVLEYTILDALLAICHELLYTAITILMELSFKCALFTLMTVIPQSMNIHTETVA
jgi:hypothetical protein